MLQAMNADPMLTNPAADPRLWPLDPKVIFLNHGSFGSCPHAVLAQQRRFQRRLEREPIDFLVRELEPLLDDARASLAGFVGCDAEDLVFVPNATTGVNTILRSLTFRKGDELLVTDQEYNACRNALNFIAERTGARIVVAHAPFPVASPGAIVEAVLEKVSPRTRLALLDHVTSQTGMIFPIAELVARLSERGVETLIDGAHAPGMVPLNLRKLGATYYTGNCHKWMCSPKGAACLYVRRDRQPEIRPLTISHGANSPRTDRSRFLIEFAWVGTGDPSAYLSVPEAIRFMDGRLPGGWRAVMARNRQLVLAARRQLASRLGISKPCPDSMIGSLATLPLPDNAVAGVSKSPLYIDPLQESLRREARIEVPVVPWPTPRSRMIRVSAQLYNALPQYERLADALTARLP
jgi:isopenicillin-N epimerase